MSSRPVLTFFPETELSKLAARPGGIMRDIAIENAMKCLDEMRGEGDEVIVRLMQEIETIVEGSRGGRLDGDHMKAVLRNADQIVTLAESFGYEAFGRVMKSLCDVADGLIHHGLDQAAPIAVHVQAMRLVAPHSTQLSPEEIETVLAELAKVLKHYELTPIDVDEPGRETP